MTNRKKIRFLVYWVLPIFLFLAVFLSGGSLYLYSWFGNVGIFCLYLLLKFLQYRKTMVKVNPAPAFKTNNN